MKIEPVQKRGGRKKSEATRAEKARAASGRRREKAREDLRARILQAASEMFEAQGYEEFSLRGVAESIGYSATTIYAHFANKDDLLLAAAQAGFSDFDRDLARVAARQGEPLARLEALGRAYIEFGVAHPSLYRLMFMQRRESFVLPRLDDEFDEETPAPPRVLARALLVEAVRDAMARGQIQEGDAVRTADVLWASVHGLTALALSPLVTPEHAASLVAPLLQTLIHGVQKH